MDSEHSKARTNAQVDRLSMLPDDLIHRILSLIHIKHAVQTTALSSRWRFIWTSMPCLNISTDDFCSLRAFSEFVNNVLSHRNDQAEVYSVNLSFREALSEALLKTILDYAFSHNIQQLTVTWLRAERIDFPLFLLRSRSLKYLSLSGSSISFIDQYSIIIGSTWDLPALTTLKLDYVAFYDEKGARIFSKCANLKNLTLSNFTILKSIKFSICHRQLSNLTLENECGTLHAFKVVAPQLKNLTIRRCYGKHLIAAPNLVSFSSSCLLQFSTDLCSLEKVDLCIYSSLMWSGPRIACLLQQLHNVKFLTFNLELVKPLSSYMEQISLQPSPFSNLKKLKIYPLYVPRDNEAYEKVTMSTKVLNYLLDGSPSATLTMISYEEVKAKQQKAQAFANAVEAQKRMSRLQDLLEKEKANIETRTNRRKAPTEADTHDQGKTQVENVQLHFERKMAQMKSCWEDVGVQIDQGGSTARDILSRLRDIEELLLKDLPISKRDKLLACFSGLCAEVDNVIEKILHHMKIPQIHLSDCFNQLAATSLSSS
ncbi:putative leucine-rich repeat domain superfamily, F-box-like domain superfamily [Helianthus annuus]|nr:putative leucine-rich repeat domain superfamily, F-box-like domain superfamily [Helianthus annuus]KAJ0748102.1 putative leucine-rich repeat domain superfamily, F-box-like domain superfamily [Helianthus annuus]